MLPKRPPAVAKTRRLPITPAVARQLKELSDVHKVPPQAVGPSLPCAVKLASPKLDPCNVTLVDPVAGLLDLCSVLMTTVSADTTALTLPTRLPTVTVAHEDTLFVCPARQRTAVSETHAVLSHDVRPMPITGDCDDSPRCAPATAKLADPVAGKFILCIPLSRPTSIE